VSATRAPQQPAASAARRACGAGFLLGALGLASAGIVLARLFESWRVAPGPGSHVISVFGQRISYPTANTGAIVVTALAVLGLLMAGAAAWRAARELRSNRAFGRAITARSPRLLDGAWVIDDGHPHAFCAGLLRPRVYLSTGALDLLDAPALAAGCCGARVARTLGPTVAAGRAADRPADVGAIILPPEIVEL
jgi:hypothetical protein